MRGSLRRLAAHRRVLERYRIPWDPSLVVHGTFVRRSGRLAILQLLEQHVEFDAVVAANDGMALGAVAALRARGRRVPGDIPVTGFDDLVMARLGTPPLTTVRQPLQAMARLAVRTVVEQLQKQPVPERTVLPTEFVPRQSCGCHLRIDFPKDRPVPTLHPTRPCLPPEHAAHIERVLISCLSAELGDAANVGARWVKALSAELEGSRDAFIRALDDTLEMADNNELFSALQTAITLLRDALRGLQSPELEDMWHEARSLIAQANTRAQMQQRLELGEVQLQILGIGERLAAALDMASLRDALIERLPSLGVDTVCISLYAASNPAQLEVFLCLRGGVPRDLNELTFDAKLLFPPGAFPWDSRATLVVYPLTFEVQPLGVIVFEHKGVGASCQVVRDRINSALGHVLLHQQMLHKTTLHERSVQERAAFATRMKSLSALAGGVAHDLNNALGPMVGLADSVLADIVELGAGRLQDDSQLRLDVESIKTAGLRAAQTIKDLLTLGREGRTHHEPVDLNRVVAEVTSELLDTTRSQTRHVQLQVDLDPRPLVVSASEAQLARAVTNLIRNGVEAIEGAGTVSVATSHVVLDEPLSGFETVEPGDYAVIVVSDTGAGIPMADLPRIFEPFFTNKRTGEHTGTGLGLSIVHSVLQEHKGFIDVGSTVDRGTRFSLYLPRVDQMPKRLVSVSPAPGGWGRILLVDDEPVQLRTASRILARAGYEVATVDSGQKACGLIEEAQARNRESVPPLGTRRSPYDLVILDMILNDKLDGLQVLENIRKLYPEQKALLVSGHAPSYRLEVAVSRGLAWLAKPYTNDALLKAVHAALSADG